MKILNQLGGCVCLGTEGAVTAPSSGTGIASVGFLVVCVPLRPQTSFLAASELIQIPGSLVVREISGITALLRTTPACSL